MTPTHRLRTAGVLLAAFWVGAWIYNALSPPDDASPLLEITTVDVTGVWQSRPSARPDLLLITIPHGTIPMEPLPDVVFTAHHRAAWMPGAATVDPATAHSLSGVVDLLILDGRTPQPVRRQTEPSSVATPRLTEVSAASRARIVPPRSGSTTATTAPTPTTAPVMPAGAVPEIPMLTATSETEALRLATGYFGLRRQAGAWDSSPQTRGLLAVLAIAALAAISAAAAHWRDNWYLAGLGVAPAALALQLHPVARLGLAACATVVPRLFSADPVPRGQRGAAVSQAGKGPVDGADTPRLATCSSRPLDAGRMDEGTPPQHTVGIPRPMPPASLVPTGSTREATSTPGRPTLVLDTPRPVPEPEVHTPWRGVTIGRAPSKTGHLREVTRSLGPMDTEVDGGRIGPVAAVAASTRGGKHRLLALPRQDAVRIIARHDGRGVCAAVADGVSEAAKSHLAASIAVAHAVKAMSFQRDPDFAQLMVEVSRVIESTAKGNMADYATTLVCASLDVECGYAQVAAVGDSTAMVLRRGRWMSCFQPSSTLVRDVRTKCLPHHAGAVVVVDVHLEPDDALFLMSDGLSDPLGDGTGEVGRYLAERWSGPPEPLEFAQNLDFVRRSYDDDRSAVGLWFQSNESRG